MAEALPEYPDSDFSDDEKTPEDQEFDRASNHVRTITTKLSSDQLLQLYGLFKQGTEGRCSIPKPFFNLQGRQKWEAWKALGDMPELEAKVKYTALVEDFDPEWAEANKNDMAGTKETWVSVSTHQKEYEPELESDELSILDAAREDFSEKLEELLSQNPELVNVTDEGGLTALHWAADRDATNSLRVAIKHGCVLDAVEESGQTALHYAVSCGHINSTKILLEAGASPSIKDDEGMTPLDLSSDDEVKKFLECAVK